jgi:hypothetical protein
LLRMRGINAARELVKRLDASLVSAATALQHPSTSAPKHLEEDEEL